MLNLFYELKEAYETSTPSNNRFLAKLNSINWEDKFYVDDEYYFAKGDMLFVVQLLNPFDEKRKPSATFLKEGSIIEF